MHKHDDVFFFNTLMPLKYFLLIILKSCFFNVFFSQPKYTRVSYKPFCNLFIPLQITLTSRRHLAGFLSEVDWFNFTKMDLSQDDNG